MDEIDAEVERMAKNLEIFTSGTLVQELPDRGEVYILMQLGRLRKTGRIMRITKGVYTYKGTRKVED